MKISGFTSYIRPVAFNVFWGARGFLSLIFFCFLLLIYKEVVDLHQISDTNM
jgi:hypothetical protein